MSTDHGNPTVTPGLLYDDAPRAIEWLCRAFGFERRLVVPGPDGSVMHAHLTHGHGGVFLGSAGRGELPWFTSPRATAAGA
jgi:uncharacterized glyoxalase superfamily protein PhnB